MSGFLVLGNEGLTFQAMSLEAAARELARTPEAQEDVYLQDEICRKYGIILDDLTHDEIIHLEALIEDFASCY